MALAAEVDDWVTPGSSSDGPDDWVSAATAPSRSSTAGAFARGAERGALPAAGGLAGFAAGAEVGGAIGALGGPAAPVTTPVGAFVGGMAGAYGGGTAVDAAQRWVLDHAPDSVVKALGLDKEQEQSDVEEHPIASFTGELAPNLALIRPGAVAKAAEDGAPAIEKLLTHPITARAVPAAIMGTQEAASEEFQNGEIDPTKVAIASGVGALSNRETALGQRIGRLGAAPVEAVTSRLSHMASPEEAAAPVLEASSVDEAIAAASEVVNRPPLDVDAMAETARKQGEEARAAGETQPEAVWQPLYDEAGAEIGQYNAKTEEMRLHEAVPSEDRGFTTTPGAIAAEHAAEVSSLEAEGTRAAAEPTLATEQPAQVEPELVGRLRGGIKNDEGHDLSVGRGLQQFIPGIGPLIRPKGMSIDYAGEALHQAGYFGPPEATPRPTENEVLQLLEGTSRGTDGKPTKVFTPDDQANVTATRAAVHAQDDNGRILQDLHDQAKAYGEVLSEDQAHEIAADMAARGIDPESAIAEHIERQALREVYSDHEQTGDQAYADAIHEPRVPGEADLGAGEGGQGSEIAGSGEAGPDEAGAAAPEDTVPARELSFTTAKGSTYETHPDGTTTRNKAARTDPGHEGQHGPQPRSQRTFYVTQEHANELGLFQAHGVGAKMAVAERQDGTAGVKYVDGPNAGKFEKRTVAKVARNPAPGLIPVETWKDGTRVHFGNEITKVEPKVATERGVEGIDQTILPGSERSARQLAQAREDQGHGRIQPKNQQKAADEGLFGEAGTHEPTLFHRSKDEPKELIVQHNISAGKLLHADRMGGLAAPSLAVTKAEHPLEGFGEITLLAHKDMADPKKGAKVFGADIYSPRYPTLNYRLKDEALKRLDKVLGPYFKADERHIYSAEISTPGDLRGVPAFERYAKEKSGEKYPDYEAIAKDLLEKVGAEERIFRGFNNNGNRTYKAHTLENVVAILKKELRGGENWNYGVGSLRAHYTPQFRSIEAIRSARGKLQSKEAFEAVKKEVDEEFWTHAEELKPYYKYDRNAFGFGDTVINVMADASKQGLPRALREYGFENVPENVMRESAEFLNKLRNIPTEYFEVKHLRGVGVSEFHTAVIPDTAPQNVRDVLDRRGIRTVEYKNGDEGARRAAIQQTASDSADDLMFSRQGSGDIRHGRVTGVFTPEFDAMRDTVGRDLRARLDKMGLHEISLKLPDAIIVTTPEGETRTNGAYAKKIIAVALDQAPDGIGHTGVFDHETVHAARHLGLFTKSEWSILSNRANRDWREKFQIDKRYPDLAEEKRNEEAIAEAYRTWVDDSATQKGTLASIFNKVRDTLAAIGNVFRGHGFQTEDGIFRKLNEGEVGARERATNPDEEVLFQIPSSEKDGVPMRAVYIKSTGKVEFRPVEQKPKPALSATPPAPRGTSLRSIEGTGEERQRAIGGELYNVGEEKPQLERAATLVQDNFKDAVAIAMRRKNPPAGLHPEFVYMAVEAKATKDGDFELQRKLSQSKIAEEATTMGQRIAAWRNRAEIAPVDAMRRIQDARAAKAKERGIEPAKAVETIVENGRQEIRAAAKSTKRQSWNDLVLSLVCSS